jgi:hypothetical protein
MEVPCLKGGVRYPGILEPEGGACKQPGGRAKRYDIIFRMNPKLDWRIIGLSGWFPIT